MSTPILPTVKSPAFLRAASFIIPHETEYARGHYNDNNFTVTEDVPGDSGGLTKFGIDATSHPRVDIRALTYDTALDIYFAEWISHRLDLLPERLAIAAFDVYVNGGYPIKWLQQAYNNFHQDGKPLTEDNQLGPKTLAALTSSNQDVLLRYFFKQRDARFDLLAASPARAKFLDGWLVRDKDLEKFLNVYYPPTN